MHTEREGEIHQLNSFYLKLLLQDEVIEEKERILM